MAFAFDPGAGTQKTFRLGTDRLRSPEETVAGVAAQATRLGITRVANVTGLDRIGIPVVAVVRPNSRSVAVAQGKGATIAAAKASGMMEALENHHAENVEAPLLLLSHKEISRSRAVVDVSGLPRTRIGDFDDHRRLLWIEGQDLVARGPAWLPYELVHTDYTLPLPAGSGAFLMSSNGLASGNHLYEAISHGICEVVERDAITLWELSGPERRTASRLRLSTIEDENCRQLLDRLEHAQVLVVVWDATSDVGIPCFRCELADAPGATFRPLPPLQGTGCHPRPEIALSRAITEAAQTRLTVISGSRDDVSQWLYDDTSAVEQLRAFYQRYENEPASRRFLDCTGWNSDSLAGDVAQELERLEAAGCKQVLGVDLTKADFGVPVVRIVIPGLEPMADAPGYRPGLRAQRRLGAST